MNRAYRLDLLVYPFGEMSTITLGLKVDERTRKNALRFRDLWLGSIGEIAQDRRRYLALVNGVDLPDAAVCGNPLRYLYKEIIGAVRELGPRLFYFGPTSISGKGIITQKKGNCTLAIRDGTSMFYDPQDFDLTAYGEHVSDEGCGCVETTAREMTSMLGLGNECITIDPDKSLPSLRLIREPGTGRYVIPKSRYFSVTEMKGFQREFPEGLEFEE